MGTNPAQYQYTLTRPTGRNQSTPLSVMRPRPRSSQAILVGELHQSTALWTLARMLGIPTGMTALLASTRASVSWYISSDTIAHFRYENEVIAITLETTNRTFRFEAEPLPRFSRSRVLVPVASHYFKEQSDDYMSWGNVRLSIVGTIPQCCESNRPISLTSTDHPKKRTPIQIRFAGS